MEEEMKICISLLDSLVRVPVGSGSICWNRGLRKKSSDWGWGEDLCDPLDMDAENKEGLHQMLC